MFDSISLADLLDLLGYCPIHVCDNNTSIPPPQVYSSINLYYIISSKHIVPEHINHDNGH